MFLVCMNSVIVSRDISNTTGKATRMFSRDFDTAKCSPRPILLAPVKVLATATVKLNRLDALKICCVVLKISQILLQSTRDVAVRSATGSRVIYMMVSLPILRI